MSNNREERVYQESLHLYLALQRTEKSSNKKCLRHVITDEETDLKIMEAKCRVFGGEWRIHKIVNSRNVEKARKWLLSHLIKNPENASFTESCWKTALLQRECRETKYFMLDVDTQDEEKLQELNHLLYEVCEWDILENIKSPKGYHIITRPFDTREVCELDYVTLLRDGYHYVKTVGEK